MSDEIRLQDAVDIIGNIIGRHYAPDADRIKLILLPGSRAATRLPGVCIWASAAR